MDKDTKELLDLIKLRNNQNKELLENIKNGLRISTSDKINLEFVINHLHTLNLFIDKDIEKKVGK
tara:strand:+ start:221 stop:415 length:195 start_codon:yes stop_codon:yes gene_type:complete